MRGDITKDNKVYYNWSEFERDCYRLKEVIEASVVRPRINNVHGVVRGGVALAVRLASLFRVPLVSEIGMYTLVCDEVVDSGFTRSMYPSNMFVSIHVKPWADCTPDYFISETKDWIVYPWEETYREKFKTKV